MKQTAVEWFAEQDTLVTIDFLEGKLNQLQLAIKKTTILENAKAMEKEQIMDAVYYAMGTNFDPNMGRAELYYNTTFKSE